MSRFCSVNKCQNNNNSQFSFHKIPEGCNHEWLKVIDRGSEWSPKKYSVICNAHFSPHDISKGRLKRGAIPSLNPASGTVRLGKLTFIVCFLIYLEYAS